MMSTDAAVTKACVKCLGLVLPRLSAEQLAFVLVWIYVCESILCVCVCVCV